MFLLTFSTFSSIVAAQVNFPQSPVQTTNASSQAGNNNLFIGASTGNSNAGFNNSILGSFAGAQLNAASDNNTFVGFESGANTTADNNTFMGFRSGFSNTGGATTGNNNTFIGSRCGEFNLTGHSNTFIGTSTGLNNITGIRNVYIGMAAGGLSQNSNNNTFVGFESGANTTANNNTFIGARSGFSNTGSATTGTNNTFIGARCGEFNLTGHSNTFIGTSTGLNNISGFQNLFIGMEAGGLSQNQASGSSNVFIGHWSGATYTTASNNIGIGINSARNLLSGQNNIFIGLRSGFSNTIASNNVFMGFSSGDNTNTGSNNTFIGLQSGFSNTNGQNNSFFGVNAGISGANHTNCSSFGANSGLGSTNHDFATAIGANSIADCNDCMVLGNGSISRKFSVGVGTSNPVGNFMISDMSGLPGSTDIRFSDLPLNNSLNYFLVIENPAGSPKSTNNDTRLFVKQLNIPTNYNNCSPTTNNYVPYWNTQGLTCLSPIYIDPVTVNTTSGSVGIGTNSIRVFNSSSSYVANLGPALSGTKALLDVNGLTFTNTLVVSSDKRYKTSILQLTSPLEKLLSMNGYSYYWDRKNYPAENFDSHKQIGFLAQELEKVVPEVVFKDQNGNYAVNYNAIIPIVVEAMKEQQKEITQLKSRLSEIENMALACCSINSAKQQQKVSTHDMSYLYQNEPNPFTSSCTIKYFVHDEAKKTSIYIYNLNQQVVLRFENLSIGIGTVNVSANSLPAGNYIYTLQVDGQKIDSKILTVTK